MYSKFCRIVLLCLIGILISGCGSLAPKTEKSVTNASEVQKAIQEEEAVMKQSTQSGFEKGKKFFIQTLKQSEQWQIDTYSAKHRTLPLALRLSVDKHNLYDVQLDVDTTTTQFLNEESYQKALQTIFTGLNETYEQHKIRQFLENPEKPIYSYSQTLELQFGRSNEKNDFNILFLPKKLAK